MTDRSEAALVAEIKQLYGRRHEEKLQIQKDMVELRDGYGRTQPEIARATGIPQQTVSDWLRAFDEATDLGRPSRLTPDSHKIRSDRAVARRVIAEDPEFLASLTPEAQRKAAVILDTESAKRQNERERLSKQKEREHLGDDVVDGLDAREQLDSTAYLLIKARGNLRGFVKQLGEIGLDNTSESWRESCLDWIDDLTGHLGMARALLAGDDIDWTAFEDLLAKEGS
jgi:transcriptional regulator with XRE-family HTH domain